MTDPQQPDQWEAPKGPLTKIIAWLILICLALFILAMIAIIIWT